MSNLHVTFGLFLFQNNKHFHTDHYEMFYNCDGDFTVELLIIIIIIIIISCGGYGVLRKGTIKSLEDYEHQILKRY